VGRAVVEVVVGQEGGVVDEADGVALAVRVLGAAASVANLFTSVRYDEGRISYRVWLCQIFSPKYHLCGCGRCLRVIPTLPSKRLLCQFRPPNWVFTRGLCA